jgi:small GTP-binding protein
MIAWILTDGTEKILATKNGVIGIDEKVIAKAMSSIIGQSKRVDEIGRIDLPNSTMFYKQVHDNYCLFIIARKSVGVARVEGVFEEVSVAGREHLMTLETLSNRITSALSRIKTKVLIMGYAGVGKTTIKDLLRGKTLPLQHNPTIGVEVIQLTEDTMIWDTAGQVGYLQLLPQYLKGADLVVVVSDSTLKNALMTKKLVDTLRHNSRAHFVVIANKQDQLLSLTPSRVAQIIAIDEFIGLTALDTKQRESIIDFINRGLN